MPYSPNQNNVLDPADLSLLESPEISRSVQIENGRVSAVTMLTLIFSFVIPF